MPGFLTTFRKIATSVAVGLLLPQVLAATGFVEGAATTQPPATVLALRLFMGAVPAVLLLLSMIAAVRYPLTRDAHAALRLKLEERRAAQQHTVANH
ncbi:MAG: MFS transporter [Caldilineaceae bacterium]